MINFRNEQRFDMINFRNEQRFLFLKRDSEDVLRSNALSRGGGINESTRSNIAWMSVKQTQKEEGRAIPRLQI